MPESTLTNTQPTLQSTIKAFYITLTRNHDLQESSQSVDVSMSLFSSFTHNPFSIFPLRPTTPPLDIKESPDRFDITIELPGLEKSDVAVEVSGNDQLTISGEKKREKIIQDKEYYHLEERSYGKFVRRLKFPVGVDVNKVQAEFKDGVLKVSVPKVENKKVDDVHRVDIKYVMYPLCRGCHLIDVCAGASCDNHNACGMLCNTNA